MMDVLGPAMVVMHHGAALDLDLAEIEMVAAHDLAVHGLKPRLADDALACAVVDEEPAAADIALVTAAPARATAEARHRQIDGQGVAAGGDERGRARVAGKRAGDDALELPMQDVAEPKAVIVTAPPGLMADAIAREHLARARMPGR